MKGMNLLSYNCQNFLRNMKICRMFNSSRTNKSWHCMRTLDSCFNRSSRTPTLWKRINLWIGWKCNNLSNNRWGPSMNNKLRTRTLKKYNRVWTSTSFRKIISWVRFRMMKSNRILWSIFRMIVFFCRSLPRLVRLLIVVR